MESARVRPHGRPLFCRFSPKYSDAHRIKTTYLSQHTQIEIEDDEEEEEEAIEGSGTLMTMILMRSWRMGLFQARRITLG
jgi:hypothetical protein